MKNNTSDQSKYDGLDSSDPSEELKDLDEWILALPLKEVGTNFTSTVIASALLAQKRQRNFKLIVWLMVFFGALITCSIFLVNTMDTSMDLSYLNKAVSATSGFLDLIANPRMRQLFLVVEGMLCLVVLEKITSNFRLLKRAV